MDLIHHLILRKNQELLIQNSSKVSEEILSHINQNCTLHQPNIGDIMKQLCPMDIHWLSGFKLDLFMQQEFTLLNNKE